MVVTFRAMKPGYYNVDAMVVELMAAANEIADGMQADFEETTASWEHNVQFEKSVAHRSQEIRATVGTDDDIYCMVTKGSPAHPIYPKKAAALRFQTGYRAKTTPRQLRSRGGGKHGQAVFRAYVKRHPGFEGRQFDEAVADKWRRRSPAICQRAINRGVLRRR